MKNVGRGGEPAYGPPPRPRQSEFMAPQATGMSNTRLEKRKNSKGVS